MSLVSFWTALIMALFEGSFLCPEEQKTEKETGEHNIIWKYLN